ncbi:hypothetical protein M8C21_001925, partial [Ambrosia artemisiifolia]
EAGRKQSLRASARVVHPAYCRDWNPTSPLSYGFVSRTLTFIAIVFVNRLRCLLQLIKTHFASIPRWSIITLELLMDRGTFKCMLETHSTMLCWFKVPKCIDKLANAGIKIWMLFSDKMETAKKYRCYPGRTTLVWFSTDLRLYDNECLSSANTDSMWVLHVYIFDPRDNGKSSSGFDKTGPYRASIGKPETVITEFVKAVGAEAIYTHNEVSFDEVKGEKKLEMRLKDEGVDVKYFWGSTLYHVDDLPFKLEGMPTNCGGFREKVKGLKIRKTIEAVDQLRGQHAAGYVEAAKIPSLADLGLNPTATMSQAKASASLVGGETEALERLKRFASKCKSQPLKDGSNDSSMYGAKFSCKISPWLAMGCLSPRYMFDELKKSASRPHKSQETGRPSPSLFAQKNNVSDATLTVCSSLTALVRRASGVTSLLIESVSQNTIGSVFVPEDGKDVKVSGSPTEKAILQWGLVMNFEAVRSESSVIHAFPFNSEKSEVEYFKNAIEDMAAGSLRCVAIAYRPLKGETVPTDEELSTWELPEGDLVCKCNGPLDACVNVWRKDPCRPGVKDVVQLCVKAGLK